MKRATRAEWSKRVERWRASGPSAAEYGRRAGVSEKSLRWWKWQLAQAHEGAPTKHAVQDAAPLTFVEMTSALQRALIEVVLVA